MTDKNEKKTPQRVKGKKLKPKKQGSQGSDLDLFPQDSLMGDYAQTRQAPTVHRRSEQPNSEVASEASGPQEPRRLSFAWSFKEDGPVKDQNIIKLKISDTLMQAKQKAGQDSPAGSETYSTCRKNPTQGTPLHITNIQLQNRDIERKSS